jgi:uncharacterized protein YkwD
MSHARGAFVMLLALLGLAAPAAAVADIPSESAAMIHKVNEARRASGVPALQTSEVLTGSARSYARYMLKNDYFGHLATIRAGGSFLLVGETLEWHSGWQPRVGLAFSNWMGSPPHHAVLMNPAFRFIGAGRVRGRWGTRKATAWVAHLGGGQPAAPRLLP